MVFRGRLSKACQRCRDRRLRVCGLHTLRLAHGLVDEGILTVRSVRFQDTQLQLVCSRLAGMCRLSGYGDYPDS